MLGSDDDSHGIAGLGGRTTMVAGLPTVRPQQAAAPRVRPDWPLVLLMALVAVSGAYGLISGEWGEGGPQRGAEDRGVVPGVRVPAGSPLEAGNFAEALETLRGRARGGARVLMMRVDAGQVWTVLTHRDGTHRVVRLTAGGSLSDEGTSAGEYDGVPLEAVDAEAPARIMAGLRERYDVASARVDYLALTGFADDGRGVWSAYLRERRKGLPVYFLADRRGRNLQPAP